MCNTPQLPVKTTRVPQGGVLNVTLFALEVVVWQYVHFLLIRWWLPNRLRIQISILFKKNFNSPLIMLNSGKLKMVLNYLQPEQESCTLTIKPGLHLDPDLTSYGQPLTCVESFKFLGVHFDQKLTWKHHILQLIAQCLKLVNVSNSISSNKWRSNQLLLIFRSLIRSKLDYGCIVYSSASDTTLNILDLIIGDHWDWLLEHWSRSRWFFIHPHHWEKNLRGISWQSEVTFPTLH